MLDSCQKALCRVGESQDTKSTLCVQQSDWHVYLTSPTYLLVAGHRGIDLKAIKMQRNYVSGNELQNVASELHMLSVWQASNGGNSLKPRS